MTRNAKIALSIICILVMICLAWSFTGQTRYLTNFDISAAGKKEVRLERYFKDHIFSSDEVALEGYKKWLEEFPSKHGFISSSMTMCWVPHHRIIIETKDQEDIVINLCFSCDEIRVKGGSRYHIPSGLKQHLRRLFDDNGISSEPPSSEEIAKSHPDYVERAKVLKSKINK